MGKRNVVSLFTGAGGMDIGFEMAGYRIAAAVENDKHCCATLRHNRPRLTVIEKDISKISGQEILAAAKIRAGSVYAVIGGPPCQGFSQVGKRNPNDPRNYLYKEFFRLISELKPTTFLMENTFAILNKRNREIFYKILLTGQNIGYCVGYQLLDSSDFGTPQKRKRCFIFGKQMPNFSQFFESKKTVIEAIGDLETVEYNEEDNHIWQLPGKQMQRRINNVPPGGNMFDVPIKYRPRRFQNPDYHYQSQSLFRRLKPNGFSPTIVAASGGDTANFIHPHLNRFISNREAARLQTFPDNYYFTGGRCVGRKQIGNAVPPQLAYKLALAIKNY